MARRDKVTEPVTDSKERARDAHRESKREHEGSPSRERDRTGGDSEKKPGSTAPRHGGRTR